MIGFTLFFLALAVFFFFVYGRLKTSKAAAIEAKILGTARPT